MLSAPEGRADSRPPQAAATVADVMRLAAETVAEGDHVAAATYLMQHASATSLLVTDFQAGKPVGVITAADIARAVADGRAAFYGQLVYRARIRLACRRGAPGTFAQHVERQHRRRASAASQAPPVRSCGRPSGAVGRQKRP